MTSGIVASYVVVPVATLRTGFVLIGWSVSFTYLEMDRFWRG